MWSTYDENIRVCFNGKCTHLCSIAGFVGLFSALFLWPGFFILHYSDNETFQWPNSRQWMFIAINGVVGTVLSDFLWLW